MTSIRTRLGCVLTLVATLAAVAFFFTSPMHGQVTGATLTGTVTDSAGNVIPHATVHVVSLAQGITHAAQTNDKGDYIFPNLQPGAYNLDAGAAGFTTARRTGITLTVGERPVIDLMLSVGSVAQTVEVQDTTSSVELGTSSVSEVVDGKTTRELPLNGRDWTQLATLQPGIAAIRSQPDANSTSSRGNRGYGQQLSIAGGRPQQNSYRLDGININDYANSAPGSTAGLSLGAEAIQEFSVISSNYSASYGLTSGGVVNAITRGGTNKFHGSAYEFVRNDLFDARGFFDTAKLPFRRNQFGATIGGPILKGKTFFFFNYEGFRQVYSTTTNATVPTALARTGVLAANPAKPVTVDPTVARYLSIFALPNGPITGDTGTYSFASKEVTPENFYTGRIDQTISDKDSLSGTYLYDKGNTTQPDSLNVVAMLSYATRQVLSISENHIFSNSFYNSLRVGTNRESSGTLITAPGANPAGTDQTLGPAPGLYAPGIQVSGLTSFGGGLNASGATTYGFTTPQFNDDAFLTKGNHSLRFGGAFERIYANMEAQSTPDGLYKFGSLANFLTNVPQSLQVQITPATPRDIRQNIYGAYFEDDWKAARNLTLVLGARYEPASVPSEIAGKLSNLRSISAATPFTGDPFFMNPTLKNIEPRVGFSYSPPSVNGRTVLRGGFGIFDVLPLTYQFNLMTNQATPFMINVSSTALPAGSFATAGYSLVSGTPAGKQRVTYVQFNPPRNYVEQYNLSLEQQMPAHMTLDISYVGSHGVHQVLRTTDGNIPQPTIDASGNLVFPCKTEKLTKNGLNATCGTAAPVVNPNFGQIDGQNWNVGSVYSGLLTTLKQGPIHGIQWQASFTWQKSIDGNSSVIAGGPLQNSISGQFLFHPLRAVSDFNVPKIFIANVIYQTPDVVRRGSLASYAINGWQVGGIFQATNGQPITPTISGDPLGESNTVPFDVPDRLFGPGCTGNPVNPGALNATHYIKTQCFAFPTYAGPGNRFGNAGRNSIYGPGVIELDYSMVKNFAFPMISDAAHLQFRAEMFNVANHPNLAAPFTNNKLFDVTTAAIGNAGQITSLSTSPRQIQLALKMIF